MDILTPSHPDKHCPVISPLGSRGHNKNSCMCLNKEGHVSTTAKTGQTAVHATRKQARIHFQLTLFLNK